MQLPAQARRASFDPSTGSGMVFAARRRMPLDREALDLLGVAQKLRNEFGSGPFTSGLLEGKTRMRDRLVESMRCSELEAEQLLDTLLARRFLRFESPSGSSAEGAWIFAAEVDGAPSP